MGFQVAESIPGNDCLSLNHLLFHMSLLHSDLEEGWEEDDPFPHVTPSLSFRGGWEEDDPFPHVTPSF